jgi:aspartate racemase
MEEDFYKAYLEKSGLGVVVPDKGDREIVNRVIFEELCQGKTFPASRQEYKRIMQDLVFRGARGIILGCTEIALLVKPEDVNVPLFDTTLLHAAAAVDKALGITV